MNDVILNSGLAVDYNEVSRDAEKLRLAMTRADWVEIDFTVDGDAPMTVRLELARQEAQKSHGLCRGDKPDIANLPAGEVYFVPTGAEGEFPMKYEDGTLGQLTVTGGRIIKAELIEGKQATIDEHNRKLADDPMTGVLGELGFGTQVLPVSGADIQDEKVLGTCHLATGRDDHLGGHITPDTVQAPAERHARRHPVRAAQDAELRHHPGADASRREDDGADRAFPAGGVPAQGAGGVRQRSYRRGSEDRGGSCASVPLCG